MAASLTSYDAPAIAATEVATPESAHAPVNILLVDDQAGRLLTYRAILEPLGENLIEASSGMEALKRLMEDEYAVILLDVNMPGMDGFETASLIHQHPRFEKTPIIFVTAVNVGDMDRMRGYKLGAVDYVSVPVIPEILRTKVSVLAELHRKRRELQLANAQLSAANVALEAEKTRELERLNTSLRDANTTLAARNEDLQNEIGVRMHVEERLRDADRRKDEFLATLAHELRNPLAPLLNALNIRRLSAPDAHDPLQDMMERQLGQLVRLIDDLLDIARITRGKLVLRKQVTTLNEVIQSAVETAAPLIERGRHHLSVHLPDQPVALHADHARLSQVFANLLNNAAKYSDAGGNIEVSATANGSNVEVCVRDTGIGLASEQIQHIFELFSQADTAVEKAHGGLGIGLTLVQRLTEMHDGHVSVQSEGLGKGSEFRIQLPRDPELTVPERQDVDVPPNTIRSLTKRRALVVDDNRDAADTLAMMLELMGLETLRLYDPLQVATEFASFAPDIAFMDVGMPGLSGYDLARTLRATEQGRTAILVAVTGWGQPEDRRRTREAGFNHHLVKPPELGAIQAICASLVDASARVRS
ncbi:MAG: response regulator [Lysobacter sp.]|nr:response regulator [Lysobacter sp.]